MEPLHAILPAERDAIVELYEQWGEIAFPARALSVNLA